MVLANKKKKKEKKFLIFFARFRHQKRGVRQVD